MREESNNPTMHHPLNPVHWVCPECGYDLRGDVARRCPECGFHFEPAALLDYALAPTYRAFAAYREVAVLSGASTLFGLLSFVPAVGGIRPIHQYLALLVVAGALWNAWVHRDDWPRMVGGKLRLLLVAFATLYNAVAQIAATAALALAIARLLRLPDAPPHGAESLSRDGRRWYVGWRIAAWVLFAAALPINVVMWI